MALPATFLKHLQTEGYHSRSDKHSNSLAEAIVIDLMAHCPKIAAQAKARELVFSLNHELAVGANGWKTDLAIGPPPPQISPKARDVAGMTEAVPATTRIAVELKSVMTEHLKARKNRKRDLESHHQHVHAYDPQCIAAGILVVNASQTFKSPLRPEITVHAKTPDQLIQIVADEFHSLTMSTGQNSPGLDAKCLIAVSMDNVNHAATRYVTRRPALQVGHPAHWDSFIQRLCTVYSQRWP